ncbi:hypothetical protein E4U43_004014 [Claviceps pusilla]|uniref:Uncharacterized protein n=1 Tax=Claviceps pusilla TaxID=123648 RepID=A0A9P7N6N2_9HYPO|nr:hypothetical protein E4U43_004014 [Claviceps pusilla]
MPFLWLHPFQVSQSIPDSFADKSMLHPTAEPALRKARAANTTITITITITTGCVTLDNHVHVPCPYRPALSTPGPVVGS